MIWNCFLSMRFCYLTILLVLVILPFYVEDISVFIDIGAVSLVEVLSSFCIVVVAIFGAENVDRAV